MPSKYESTDSQAVRVRLGWLLVLSLISPLSGLAQTNLPSRSSQAQRYLFVVETSKSMQRRAQGCMQTLQTLLNSRLGGQLHPGDSLGMWAYNATITQATPFEPWDPQTQVAQHLTNFLHNQKYENEARIDALWPEVQRLVRDSSNVTIVLLSAGENKFAGTPFDRQINEAWQQWHDNQQKLKMPIVTLFRALNGNIVSWSVTPAPWPVDFAPPTERTPSPQIVRAPSPPASTNLAAQRSGSGKPAFSELPPATTNALTSNSDFARLTSALQPTGHTATVAAISNSPGMAARLQTNLVIAESASRQATRDTNVSNPPLSVSAQQTNSPAASRPQPGSQTLVGNPAAATAQAIIPRTGETTNAIGSTVPDRKSETHSNTVPQTLPATVQAPSPSAPMEPAKAASPAANLSQPPVTAPAPAVAVARMTETNALPDQPAMKSPAAASEPARQAASDLSLTAQPQTVRARSASAEPSPSLASGGQRQQQVPTQSSDAPELQKRRFSLRHLAVLVLLILSAVGSVFCFFMYAKTRLRRRQKTPLFPRELATAPRAQPQTATEQQAPAEDRPEPHQAGATASSPTSANSGQMSGAKGDDSPKRTGSTAAQEGPLPHASHDSPASSRPKPVPGTREPLPQRIGSAPSQGK